MPIRPIHSNVALEGSLVGSSPLGVDYSGRRIWKKIRGGLGVSSAKRLFTTAYFAVRGRIETRVPYWSERAIRERQTTNLRKIVTHAFRYVPYYRMIERSLGLSERDIQTVDDLSRLPLIDGRTLQRDPQHFVSDAFDPASLRKVHSTGTAA